MLSVSKCTRVHIEQAVQGHYTFMDRSKGSQGGPYALYLRPNERKGKGLRERGDNNIVNGDPAKNGERRDRDRGGTVSDGEKEKVKYRGGESGLRSYSDPGVCFKCQNCDGNGQHIVPRRYAVCARRLGTPKACAKRSEVHLVVSCLHKVCVTRNTEFSTMTTKFNVAYYYECKGSIARFEFGLILNEKGFIFLCDV